MKVVIVEDELPSSRRLERMLSEFDYEILSRLISVRSTVAWLKQNAQPDILFLDIQLSDGLCFEIFTQVEIKSVIVFTTAYSEYSIKAFDYNSIAYLIKPVQKDQLQKAIKKATTFYYNKNELLELKTHIEENNIQTYKDRFTVRVGKRIRLINIEDVECFFSKDNTTYLRSNAFNYIIDSPLLILEKELNPSIFFKVNRKFIVNGRAIKTIVPYTNNRLRLQLRSYNESDIIVSREKVKTFKNWLG